MRIDFGFTKDGDLMLGEQQTNAEGELLYRDPARPGGYTTEVSETTIPMRDIGVQFGIETMQQMIMNRLRTENPDWLLHDGIGADLSDLIGEGNTRETMEQGKAQIKKALLYDETLNERDFQIDGFPYDAERIMYVITLKQAGRQDIRIPFLFHVELGLLDAYEVESE